MAADYALYDYDLCDLSSETVSFLRPLALLLASTARPFLELMRLLNPCLLALLRRDGWYVLFIISNI